MKTRIFEVMWLYLDSDGDPATDEITVMANNVKEAVRVAIRKCKGKMFHDLHHVYRVKMKAEAEG